LRVFGLLSAVVSLSTGAVIDLNSLYRQPTAVIALFLLIVFFALVFLDVLTIALPSSVAGRQQSKEAGFAGSVGMGFFAGLLSTPCSGALLGAVLVWAQSQPLSVSSTAIILMGAGMALPYALLVGSPKLLDFVPKPGTWMEIFKKACGFLLLVKDKPAFEAYYTSLPSGTPVVQWTSGSLDNAGENLTFIDALGRVIQSFTYKDSWYPLTDGKGFSLTILDPLNPDLAVWSQKAGWRASTVSGGSPGTDQTGLAPDSIVVNELLAHSDGNLPDWIELYNTTDKAISIGGWFLSDSENNLMKYSIPESIEIPAYGYVVFYEDLHFGTAFALSENGETVYLTSGSGGQLTGYHAIQPFEASERAVTLGRYIKSDGDMDFIAMSQPTPGAANSDPRVGPIVITEIQYHPSPDNTGDEYLELYNLTDGPIILQDLVKTEISPGVFIHEPVSWAFTKGIDFTFPPAAEIPAGGFLIVARNPAAFCAYYAAELPQDVLVLGPFENDTALSNGGEKVRLCRPGEKAYGQLRNWIRVDQVNYDDESPWPTEPDGGGAVLHRIALNQYGNDASNWTASPPTPGQ